MKKKLNVPKFKNEDDEFEFWSNLDLSDYFKPGDFVPVSFPNLKPTTRAISVRILEYIIARLKEQANALNIPYQSLMKQYIAAGATGRNIMRPRARGGMARRSQGAGRPRRSHVVSAR